MARNTDSSGTLLIVGQDQQLVDLLSLILKRADFGTTCAYDAASAVRLLKQNSPDLAVVDVRDGLDGFEPLSKSCRRSHIPIFALVADGTPVQTIGGLHAVDYLIKPIRQSELMAGIQRNLPHRFKTLQVGKLVLGSSSRPVNEAAGQLIATS